MKTYWLEKRSSRSNVTKNITIQEPPQWMNRPVEKRYLSGGNSIGAMNSSSPIKCGNIDGTIRASGGPRISSPTPFSSPCLAPDERRIYTPIIFQDFSRRSVGSSPIKNPDDIGNYIE